MKTEAWWKSYEKEWLLERYDREITEQDRGQGMKRLRRVWWHISEDIGLLGITVALFMVGALLWILTDRVLGFFR